MKKVAFYTLGCKVNQYETEALSGIFEKEGYEVVAFDTLADVYVINTCTVTNLSDRKSRQMIRRARSLNNEAVIAVVGCYSQTAPEEVSLIPGVNLVLGTKDRTRILEFLKDIKSSDGPLNAVGNIMDAREFEELNLEAYKGRTRAFLKIQEGCSQYCTYCIIPYARGPIRSRPPEDVIEEVKMLSSAGFKEVVLTGIHVASYGKDIKNTSLIDIMKKVHAVQGIERIRLGSIEPTTINDDFIEAARQLPKLCPHYHVSLQSGCDETLKRMNRRYTSEEYRRVVERLRNNIKDVAISTDIMAGFPGETEEEFEKTFKFAEEISFSSMHVFKYSPRKGTPAATFGGQVKSEIKEERSARLIELAKQKLHEFNSRYVGRVMPVLFEQQLKEKPGFFEGLTVNYIRVLAEGDAQLTGEIRKTKILEAKDDFTIGTVEN